MRRIFPSVGAIMMLTVCPVMGADLLKALQPPTGYDWTGFYLGAHVGGIWDRTDWFEDSTLSGSGGIGPVGFHDASLSTTGFFGGGQGGWNYQTGWVVWGVEADGSAAALSHSVPCFPEVTGTVQSCSTRVPALGTFTARVGAAFDSLLLYFQAGGAWEDEKLQAICNVCGLLGTPTNAVYAQGIGGLTLGGGVEYAFAGKWSAFLQYNYVTFGNRDLTFLFQPPNLPSSGPMTEYVRETANIVEFGINYRFGGPYW